MKWESPKKVVITVEEVSCEQDTSIGDQVVYDTTKEEVLEIIENALKKHCEDLKSEIK